MLRDDQVTILMADDDADATPQIENRSDTATNTADATERTTTTS